MHLNSPFFRSLEDISVECLHPDVPNGTVPLKDRILVFRMALMDLNLGNMGS